MTKVLYSALDVNNNQKYGYIDAISNTDALEQLKQKNYSTIFLYNDILLSTQRDDLKNFSDKELEENAKLEITMQFRPTFKTFITATIQKYRWSIILGLIMGISGIFGFFGFEENDLLVITVGIVVSLLGPLIALLNYPLISSYMKLFHSFAYGSWDDTQSILAYFSRKDESTLPIELNFELNCMHAKLLAIHSRKEESLAIIQKKYEYIKNISPVRYSILLADIEYINGNYKQYLNRIQKLYLENSNNAMVTLELAFAEVRFGESEKANELLNNLNYKELVYTNGLPILNLVKGMITKKKDITQALIHFEDAVSKLLELRSNSIMLPLLAIASGQYSIALYDNGEKENAKIILHDIWDILKIHGDKYLHDEIYKRNLMFKDI